MKRIVFVGLIVGFGVAPAAAQQQDAPDRPQVHVVRPGDTLWDLARRYLDDPFRWPEIFSANREAVRDPHWIYPLETLLIPRFGTVAARDRTGTLGIASPASGPTVFAAAPLFAPGGGPAPPMAAAAIPVVTAGSFFSAGMLVPEAAISPVGRIAERVGPTVVAGRMPLQIQPYDLLYLPLLAPVSVGARLHLLRPEQLVAPYGRLFTPTGTARVVAVDAGVATLEVDGFYAEVRVGDLAVPMPDFPVPPGATPVPATGLEGTLLAFADPQPVLTREDLVFVDLGARSGVVEGDEFVVFLPSRIEPWGIRPELELARLQVVRATQLTSAARVVSLQHAALEPGLPVRLVGKMP